ncbi:AHH domain-containing protein [Flavobacterium tructae]|uniref:AHH domain-containing protein n=1 Tax=Flavobacterium tructae TaxID=1114873 RepID=UPI002551E69C|nr:AHH domain-containing protein [Flavobacterium tructae]MDL2141950.1 AHH domain-containing protein [Flavobacterium tructae]
MGKLFKYALAFVFLALTGCEKDSNEQHETKTESAVPFEKKLINANELPADIQNYINTDDAENSAKSGNTETLNEPIFMMHDIVSMTDDKNITNYSISFFYPDTPENVYYNLVINVLPTGENKKYIFKYICNPEDFENFKAHRFDFKYFDGTTEISQVNYTATGKFTSKPSAGDDPCAKIFVPSPSDPKSNPAAGAGSGNGGNLPSGGFNTSVPGYNSPPSSGGYKGGGDGSSGHDHSNCYGSNGQYWYYAGDVRPPHPHTSKSAGPCPEVTPPTGYVPVNTMPLIKILGTQLKLSIAQIAFLRNRPDTMNIIGSYLNSNNFSDEAKSFSKEMIDIVKQDATVDNNALVFTLSAKAQNKINNDLDDSFLLSVDQYIDIDVANYLSSDPGGILAMHFSIECAVLRANHPDWSTAKIYWEASKGFIHLSLDALGLVPVFGEAADLVNGTLYLIEGDGVNATLSIASAVPIAGWAAVSTKYAIKFRQATNLTSKVKLIWRKLPDGTVYFGSDKYCRSQLRQILGLAVGNLKQAHHIIPINLQNNSIIQKAAKSGEAFHLNDALNGIPLDKAIHNGSHGNYDDLIKNRLLKFEKTNPTATPNQCYDEINKIIDLIRTTIKNNPNVPINQLNF